jgi:xylulokinase
MIINYLHLVPGLWYPGSGTKSCAASFRWYRDVFCQKEMEEAEKRGVDTYRLLDEAAERIEPGSGNLFFHPYLQGENTPYYDANLCASFTGVRTFHGKAHFSRALLEGVAYSMRDSMNELKRMGVSIEKANIIGGGSKSPLWRQILSDMLGLEFAMTRNSDSSLGAAMLAGVGIKMFDSYHDSVRRCVKYNEKVHVVPNKEVADIYNEKFKLYKEIHDVMAPVYAHMNS